MVPTSLHYRLSPPLFSLPGKSFDDVLDIVFTFKTPLRARESEREMRSVSTAASTSSVAFRSLRSTKNSTNGGRRNNSAPASSSSRRRGIEVRAGNGDTETTSNPALKAAWLASEQFGKAIGGKNKKNTGDVGEGLESQGEVTMTTREEIIESLRGDYESNYFIGGQSEMGAYSSECVFADPFVSFTGLDRFKQNVGNLGTSLKDVECKVLRMVDRGEDGVTFYWKFSAVVDALPWRPKLAASGNTTHVLEGNKVVKHIEAWDVDPWVVLKKLLVPASKLPENKWELGMLALSQQDGFGALQAISEPGVKLFAALFVLEKLPGVNLGGFETFTSLMLVATAATEFWALLISFGVVKK